MSIVAEHALQTLKQKEIGKAYPGADSRFVLMSALCNILDLS